VLVVGVAVLDRDVDAPPQVERREATVPLIGLRATAERPGGAARTASLLSRGGIAVRLVTAVADDQPGKRLLSLIDGDISVVSIVNPSWTAVQTTVTSGDQTLMWLDMPHGSIDDTLQIDVKSLDTEFAESDAVLVAGQDSNGMLSHPEVHSMLSYWASRRAMVWDAGPGDAGPVPGVTVVISDSADALELEEDDQPEADSSSVEGQPPPDVQLDRLAAALRDRWQVWAVVLIDSGVGVYMATPEQRVFVETSFSMDARSAARDRFAGTLTATLGSGYTSGAAFEEAVRDTAQWLKSRRHLGRSEASSQGLEPHADEHVEAQPGPSPSHVNRPVS
jgi:bifunctional ADP-heptose synthase (sugar kinase/adenylyltransferase)